MAPVTSQDVMDEEQRVPEKLVESQGTLSPQPSAKSPTPSLRTARSTARSKKSTVEKREMYDCIAYRLMLHYLMA